MVRSKKGVVLPEAKSVVILTSIAKESDLKEAKGYAKSLKDQFGVPEVTILNFSPVSQKKMPEFLLKSDVTNINKQHMNWQGLLSSNHLPKEKWDLALEVSGSQHLAYLQLWRDLQAGMKVSHVSFDSAEYADLIYHSDQTTQTRKVFEGYVELLTKYNLK